MKNSIYLFLLILVAACGKTEPAELTTGNHNYNYIPTEEVNDFVAHHPVLTENELEEFTADIVLNEAGQIIGGNYGNIERALTKEEATKFWTLVFGEPVIFVNELREENITYNLTNACAVVLVENYVAIAGNSVHAEGARCKTATGYFCRQFDCAQ